MYIWEVIIETWPHSTGRGNTVDQMQAGARQATYEIQADSIQEALKLSEIICLGIHQNPIVWQTKITRIMQLETGRRHTKTVTLMSEKGEVYLK